MEEYEQLKETERLYGEMCVEYQKDAKERAYWFEKSFLVWLNNPTYDKLELPRCHIISKDEVVQELNAEIERLSYIAGAHQETISQKDELIDLIKETWYGRRAVKYAENVMKGKNNK